MVVQEVFQKTQEPWRWGVQWPAVGSWQQPIERIIDADPLKTTWKVAQELSINRSLVIWHWKQIGKVKKLDKWVPSQQTKKWFWSVIFSCATTKNHFFFFFLNCDAWLKVGFILTTCDYQPSGWTEKRLQSTSQSQTYTRKGHSHCLSICCRFDSLQLFKYPLRPFWEECSANWWERHWSLQSFELALVSTKGPILLRDNVRPHVSKLTLQKLNELSYEVLPHLLHSSNLSPADSLLQAFR